ncbi:MAG: sigma-70 family RNA polymerase sigma factor [Anaerolineales bacterium]|nr:sigma-70 family RNA polymerase sigma factor [Anaerolineales bacterium]
MASHNIPTDEDLVRSIQQGALDAFVTLYERYLPSVYNRVRYTIPEMDTEDVTQEVFIAAMRSIKGFRGDAQFSTWLRTLTNRQIADYYRKRNPAEQELDHETITQPFGAGSGLRKASSSNEMANTDRPMEETIMLQQAIRKLSNNHREVVLLRFAEGLQFNEIAALQGQSLEATKSLFRRAIAALQKHMGFDDE